MNKLFTNSNNKVIADMKKEILVSNLFNFEIIDNDIPSFYQAMKEMEKCKDCKGLDKCEMISKGYRPFVSNEHIVYGACKLKKIEEKRLDDKQRINALYMPKKILEANLNDYHTNSDDRIKCYKYANKFIEGIEQSGMYIHGPFGGGKTYLLASIANELSHRGKNTMLVYFPDLARDLKSSIDSGNLENRINMLKTIDVLFIDDIGSENMTAWFRDEVLGTILNYRYLDELPTFFSSNLDYKELAMHLSNTKDGKDVKKGPRIVQRIMNMTKSFEVK